MKVMTVGMFVWAVCALCALAAIVYWVVGEFMFTADPRELGFVHFRALLLGALPWILAYSLTRLLVGLESFWED